MCVNFDNTITITITFTGESVEGDRSSENIIPHGESNSKGRTTGKYFILVGFYNTTPNAHQYHYFKTTVIEVIPRSACNATEPLHATQSVNFSAINVIIDHSLSETCSNKVSLGLFRTL